MKAETVFRTQEGERKLIGIRVALTLCNKSVVKKNKQQDIYRLI